MAVGFRESLKVKQGFSARGPVSADWWRAVEKPGAESPNPGRRRAYARNVLKSFFLLLLLLLPGGKKWN